MQSRFGQTLFGAALGIVTAAGLAGAVAVASGKMEVRKRIPLTPAAASAQVQGKVYRTTKGKAQGASASAATSNLPKAFKNGKGLVNAIAQANGWAHADFLGYGEAITHGQMNGFPVRLARFRPLSAKAYAEIVGQGFVYQLIEPMPAKAQATGFGTTYHLAYGTGVCTAQANARLAWRVGVAGVAIAHAQADGQIHYTASFYGAEASALASIRWEPAVRKAGVRQFDAWGSADAYAQAELTNWAYYPSVNAVAYAHAQVSARYTFGGGGHAQAEAELAGTMIGAGTSAGIVQSDSIAVASGHLRSYPKGYGHAHVKAYGTGDALITHTGLGQCEGVARCTAAQVIDAVVHNTKASPDDGYGVAQARAIMNRVRSAAGRSLEVFASGYGRSVKTQFVHGVANGRAIPSAKLYRIIPAQGKAASAKSELSAQVQYNLMPLNVNTSAQLVGQMEKIQFAFGEALAVATAVGSNQVNDAVKAPATRTVLVTEEPRTVEVPAESRTVIV